MRSRLAQFRPKQLRAVPRGVLYKEIQMLCDLSTAMANELEKGGYL